MLSQSSTTLKQSIHICSIFACHFARQPRVARQSSHPEWGRQWSWSPWFAYLGGIRSGKHPGLTKGDGLVWTIYSYGGWVSVSPCRQTGLTWIERWQFSKSSHECLLWGEEGNKINKIKFQQIKLQEDNFESIFMRINFKQVVVFKFLKKKSLLAQI